MTNTQLLISFLVFLWLIPSLTLVFAEYERERDIAVKIFEIVAGLTALAGIMWVLCHY